MKSASAFCVRTSFLCLIAFAAEMRAQDTLRTSRRCDGKIVHEIRVSALRPPFKGEAAHWRTVARAVGLHHTTTDTVVVRRFLALQTGGICTDFRMRESARLLRDEPFLAAATIRSVPDSLGGVRIEVETIDEISALASVNIANGRLSYLEVGNENMFGDAWLLAIHGSDQLLQGRSAGFRMSDFQFLARPYQLDVVGDWGERTSRWLVDASHGYLTDLQRIAWEAGIGHARQEYAVLNRGEGKNELAIPYRRFAADVGGILKLGNIRTPILIGSLLTVTRQEPMSPVAVTRKGPVPDTTLAGHYPKISRARLTGIGAWRNLHFIQVRGFTTVAATQDVPTGFQIFGQLGRGTHSLNGASDFFMLSDILAGAGSARTYANLHTVTEARREIGQRFWDGVVSSSRLAAFWKPNDLNLLRGWTEFAGGWRVLEPFQLGLQTEDRRLIGYHSSLFGARRAAAGVEARHVLAGMTSRGDLAYGFFINAARLWAGDAPFGVNTGVLPTAGVSIFAAVPRGSQRMLRLDFGSALRIGIPRAGWEVRLTYAEFARAQRNEPDDIVRAREQIVGPDVFRP